MVLKSFFWSHLTVPTPYPKNCNDNSYNLKFQLFLVETKQIKIFKIVLEKIITLNLGNIQVYSRENLHFYLVNFSDCSGANVYTEPGKCFGFFQDKSYPESGDTFSVVQRGSGDTHMSSKGIFPMLSTRPGVEVLRGNAAEKDEENVS